MNLAGYFNMGGYAAFIWPSYGVAVLLLTVLFLLSARRLQSAERRLGKDGDPDGASDGDDPADRA